MKTGNTGMWRRMPALMLGASMEPGHEDREYPKSNEHLRYVVQPQWSPVMKTGNTSAARQAQSSPAEPQWSPVMKTGNTIRAVLCGDELEPASMEPGHEDREYRSQITKRGCSARCLNGARS